MKSFFDKCLQNPYLKNFDRLNRHADIDLTSITVAYYLLVSILPVLLILGNLLPFLNIDASYFLAYLEDILPKQVYQITANTIINVLTRPSSGFLSLSILSAYWTASRTLTYLQKAMNRVYHTAVSRSFWRSQLVSGFVGMLMMLMLLAAVLFVTFGQSVLNIIGRYWTINQWVYRSLNHLTQPISTLILFLAITVLQGSLPNVHIPKLRYVFPGSAFSTLTLLVTSNLFGVYVNRNIAQMQSLIQFGTILVFALMLWFIFLARILIFGSLINATVQITKEGNFQPRKRRIRNLFNTKVKKTPS